MSTGSRPGLAERGISGDRQSTGGYRPGHSRPGDCAPRRPGASMAIPLSKRTAEGRGSTVPDRGRRPRRSDEPGRAFAIAKAPPSRQDRECADTGEEWRRAGIAAARARCPSGPGVERIDPYRRCRRGRLSMEWCKLSLPLGHRARHHRDPMVRAAVLRHRSGCRTMNARRLRCAIYTRKSTEEGLEQEYNSLEAQRDACTAYIKSQAGEGWTVVKTAYDDGGLSGGTMDRPALRQLLADIRSRSDRCGGRLQGRPADTLSGRLREDRRDLRCAGTSPSSQ